MRMSYYPALCVLAVLCSCSDRGEATPAPPSSEMIAGYPPGAWRMAREQLESVALTAAHILILHRGSTSDGSPLRLAGWNPDPPSQRTREDALALAARVGTELAADPTRFEALAREHSEDEVTKLDGGALGTWSANLMPGEFLDALTTMSVGTVSRVVETPLGFHLLKSLETPAATEVSAREIVIAYRGTAPFDSRPDRSLDRSRDAAFALAQQVSTELKAHPERFEQLLAQHSDHSNALRGGDIGVWSTRDAFVYHREIAHVHKLKPDEISAPIDSYEGFKVMQRRQVSARPLVAAGMIQIHFEDASRRASAVDTAMQVSTDLSKDPASFARFQSQHCCPGVAQWRQGRGHPAVEQAVSKLAIGEISRPLDLYPGSISILQRMEPGPERTPAVVRAELPKPRAPDFDFLVSSVRDPRALASYIERLQESDEVRAISAAIEPDQRERLAATFENLAASLRDPDAQRRVLALRAARTEFEHILGVSQAQGLRAQIAMFVSRDLNERQR